MGMFDEIRCKYPLPLPEFQDRLFQSKDTDQQFLDQYEIREDGTLWHEQYDIEDRSDKALGIGEDEVFGCLSRVNKRWVQVQGQIAPIQFYTFPYGTTVGWIEFRATFEGDKVKIIETVT